MPTTLDCFIMRDVFGTPEMREIFDSKSLLQGWLDTWAAVAEAEADAGLVPVAAAQTIRRVAKAENFDLEKIGAGIEEGRHFLMPAIRGLTQAAGDAGKYVHWGTTTQDITDTGMVLQCRAAVDVLLANVRDLIGMLIPIAREYRSVAMAGRTHWQHAVPITFGMKVALWIDELNRSVERLERCRREDLIAQFGGAGGTMAALGDAAEAVLDAFSRRIGLPVADAPWFNVRDRIADLVSCVGILAGTVERIATEITRLSATEIQEVLEPRKPDQVGSSTMPQKHNPINSERAGAGCRMVRGLVPVMQGLMVAAHERDMTGTEAEWLLVPQIMIMMDGALSLTRRIVRGLDVRPDHMARNLALTGGGIVAEAVMFGLADDFGRGEAHDIMLRLARTAADQEIPLADVLLADEAVRAVLSEERIRQLVDPQNYLGLAENVVDAVLARVTGAPATQSSTRSSFG
jgi:3-carboxy-cis,cis-muconate cycloisomerase